MEDRKQQCRPGADGLFAVSIQLDGKIIALGTNSETALLIERYVAE